MKEKISFDSLCAREYQRNESTKSHQLPIYATSSFVFDSLDQGIDIFTGQKEGHSYSRYGNPTIDTVANKLAKLEAYNTGLEAYGFLTSSGMSAISTLMLSTLKPGDKILTQSNLYGGTTELFSKILEPLGIEIVFIDMDNTSELEQNVESDSSIKMIYLETPANPTMAIVDIQYITDLAKQNNILTAIDNTFCTALVPVSYTHLTLPTIYSV